VRVREAEKLLCGEPLTPERVTEAGYLASQAASPISDVRASADYRREMANTLVRRALRQAAG
jgi:carbon-monoxide dehydrogenase medium subunit